MMKSIEIFVVSDSVGELGEMTTKAALSQFRPNFEHVEIRKFPYVHTVGQVEEIIAEAKKNHAAIVYTLVEEKLRQFVGEYCLRENIPYLDLLGPMIHLIQNKVNESPLEKPGLVHKLNEDYFKKVEAIEFAVKYDDGRDPRGILLADIVLVGVSRTSKTPLSQYLANKAYKVANVPLVPEVAPPEELFQVNPAKCFGLIISPDHLNNIRKERLITLGLKEDASYAQIHRIESEIDHFHSITKRIGCQVIDVTNKAVEETASIIIDLYLQQN